MAGAILFMAFHGWLEVVMDLAELVAHGWGLRIYQHTITNYQIILPNPFIIASLAWSV